MQALLIGYKLGNFTLDIIHKKLLSSDNNIEIDIGERNFQLLKLLCEASPEPLNKATLMEQLWPDTVVSDWSISRLISDTRQLLDDDGDSQSLIKTARGIGFFIPNVEHLYQSANQSFEATSQQPRKKHLSNYIAICFGIVLIIASGLFYKDFTQKKAEQAVYEAMTRISQYQDNTFTAFIAQAKRRNELVKMIEARLNIKKSDQYEKFFAKYFPQLNQQERFVCEQMRGITDVGLMENNQAIVDELTNFPVIFEEISQAKALQQHLTFWLNKYHSVFKKREDMCLLYVGVEDGVPYPSGVDQKVKDWLAAKTTE